MVFFVTFTTVMSASKPLLSSQFPPIDKIRYNEQGQVPAVLQDDLEGRLLSLVWMNPESLQKTLESSQVYRCQGSDVVLCQPELTVSQLHYDEASQALFLQVEYPKNGDHPAEFVKSFGNVLSEVFNVICDRRDNPKKGSYTCTLLSEGDNKILKKIGEESAEVVMACKDDQKDAIASEVADLFYHTLVALAYHQVDVRDVYRKLAERRR